MSFPGFFPNSCLLYPLPKVRVPWNGVEKIFMCGGGRKKKCVDDQVRARVKETGAFRICCHYWKSPKSDDDDGGDGGDDDMIQFIVTIAHIYWALVTHQALC